MPNKDFRKQDLTPSITYDETIKRILIEEGLMEPEPDPSEPESMQALGAGLQKALHEQLASGDSEYIVPEKQKPENKVVFTGSEFPMDEETLSRLTERGVVYPCDECLVYHVSTAWVDHKASEFIGEWMQAAQNDPIPEQKCPGCGCELNHFNKDCEQCAWRMKVSLG